MPAILPERFEDLWRTGGGSAPISLSVEMRVRVGKAAACDQMGLYTQPAQPQLFLLRCQSPLLGAHDFLSSDIKVCQPNADNTRPLDRNRPATGTSRNVGARLNHRRAALGRLGSTV